MRVQEKKKGADDDYTVFGCAHLGMGVPLTETGRLGEGWEWKSGSLAKRELFRKRPCGEIN